MLATAAWFFAYLVFSVPAAKVIEAVGYKRTMVISLFVMAGGAALFLPAANLVSFPMTLFAIFVLASGVCGLQTSANPYVSILGPEHSAPARLTLAQAVNSIGSLAAPWVAGVFILSDPEQDAHFRSYRAHASRSLHCNCHCAAIAGRHRNDAASAARHHDKRFQSRCGRPPGS